MDLDVKNLHPLEIRVLRHVSTKETITAERIIKELGFNIGQCNQAFSWLCAKDFFVESSRTQNTFYELTPLGDEFFMKGLFEERILNLVHSEGPLTLPEIAEKLNIENKDVGSAFGLMSKEGLLKMGDGKKVETKTTELSSRLLLMKALIAKGKEGALADSLLSEEEKAVMTAISKKRGASSSAFKIIERDDVVYQLTNDGQVAKDVLLQKNITGEEIGSLSPQMLQTGAWKNQNFRGYNVNSPPNRVMLGRRNPYTEYIQGVKDKLVSLGFEEFDGPLVVDEFWNGDALFMPQFHSARDIHDVYYVKDPSHAKAIEQPYLDQIAATHEDGWNTGSRGWGYQFDRDFTRRLVLRSQGTVCSSSQLPTAKIPGKYFGIVRCFRYDQVDATHGADFYQTEGIVLGNDVNLRTLLGLLKMFAEEVAGAEEVRYVPGYFPFTEPSIEVHIKHPVLGWFEMGGSGIFRPEVTKPLGIDVPVLAWGLGIDRMAMMQLGINDLRELFTNNIENVRLRRKK